VEMEALESPVIGAGTAARLLGISSQYLNRLAQAGKIPFEPTPYGRTYQVADVERLRVARERAARAKAAV